MILGLYANERGSSAAVIDSSGQLYGDARAAGFVWGEHDDKRLKQTLRRLADRARNRAQVRRMGIEAVCVCLQGVKEDAELARLEALIKEAQLAPVLRATSDLAALHMAAFTGRPGVVIEADQRLRVYADSGDGHPVYVEQTAGSAYSLGRDALQAATDALDGVGEATLFSEDVARMYAVMSSADMFGYMYTTGISPKDTVDMVPDVIRCSNRGDTVMNRLVEYTLRDTMKALEIALGRTEMPQPLELGLFGRLFSERDTQRLMRRNLLRKLPNSRLASVDLDPDLGACLLGLELLEDNVGLAASVLRQQRKPS
jgi:N-acetylglucosamine kinase-like BadF-type ATPase